MLKRRFTATLLTLALTYLIIPPQVQEGTHVRYEAEAPVTAWKALDQFGSAESCERSRALFISMAQEFTTTEKLRKALSYHDLPPLSVADGRQAFDLVTLGFPLTRCVNAIGSALERANY
jgi:hypothetical protein